MQVLTAVSLMAFLIVVLLLLSLVTPRDSRRAGNRKTELYRRSDAHRPTLYTKQ